MSNLVEVKFGCFVNVITSLLCRVFSRLRLPASLLLHIFSFLLPTWTFSFPPLSYFCPNFVCFHPSEGGKPPLPALDWLHYLLCF